MVKNSGSQAISVVELILEVYQCDYYDYHYEMPMSDFEKKESITISIRELLTNEIETLFIPHSTKVIKLWL